MNKLNIGMRVFCINKGNIKEGLTIGESYTITKINHGKHLNSDKEYHNIWVVNDFGLEKHYSRKRFVSVSDFRDMKINELLNK